MTRGEEAEGLSCRRRHSAALRAPLRYDIRGSQETSPVCDEQEEQLDWAPRESREIVWTRHFT